VLTGGGNYSVFIEGFLPWFMIAIGFYEIVLYLINGIVRYSGEMIVAL
jgi:hypothetical protein